MNDNESPRRFRLSSAYLYILLLAETLIPFVLVFILLHKMSPPFFDVISRPVYFLRSIMRSN